MSRQRRGFSTGVHACFAMRGALEAFLRTGEPSMSISRKIANDDIDVTIGCGIFAEVASEKGLLNLNPIEHEAYDLGPVLLYAGRGTGVVCKAGLKAPKGYAAINPVPLKHLEAICRRLLPSYDAKIYASIGVLEGEMLAPRTANEKVGVLGGISILGTSGWVKPVSSMAYLDSIETELSVISAQSREKVVLTIGESSKKEALKSHGEDITVEIGNFVFDALRRVENFSFKRVILYCGIAKALKIAQGFENTHNRYGFADLEEVESLLRGWGYTALPKESVTLRGIYDSLPREYARRLERYIEERAVRRLRRNFTTLDIELDIVTG